MFAKDARVTNGFGDVILGLLHVFMTLRSLCLVNSRRNNTVRRCALSIVVPLYFATLAGFQIMGAAFHFYKPAPATLDCLWITYLAFGAWSPCLYGVALSLDCLDEWAFTACLVWIAGAATYVRLASLQSDLAAQFSFLPTSFDLKLPSWAAQIVSGMPWMPSALQFNGQSHAGDGPLILRFDGRGYAATPFENTFNQSYSTAFDLVAPFPCWRMDSLTFLMLCVGILCNSCHLIICHFGHRSKLGHVCLMLALITMPGVMLFCGGVSAGIDWMHACALPTLLLQAHTCFELLRQAPSRPSSQRRRPFIFPNIPEQAKLRKCAWFDSPSLNCSKPVKRQ